MRILYQDSEGYIWLPTYNGLVRYDGYSVVNYGLNDGTNLPFNCYLNVVTEDQDGDLWIAAEKGVFKLHKLTGVIERIGSEKLEPLNAADIFCARNGDIWVGGDRGLFRTPCRIRRASRRRRYLSGLICRVDGWEEFRQLWKMRKGIFG